MITLPRRFIESQSSYRYTDDKSVANRELGVGFINKSGKTVDFKDHHCQQFVMVYVLYGTGTYVDEHGIRHILTQGSVFFRIPNVIHSTFIDPDSQWQECFISFAPGVYDNLLDMGAMQPDLRVMKIGLKATLIDGIQRLRDDLRLAAGEDTADINSRSVHAVMDALVSQQNVTPTTNALIQQACQLLSQDLDQSIPANEIAHRLHMSYSKFRKLFKVHMGIPPSEYRIQRRIDLARTKLLSENKSIQTIADELGYATPFAFSEQFKKFMGVSPKFFRHH